MMYRYVGALFLFVVGVLFSTQALAAPCVLTAGYEADAPYHSLDSAGTVVGMDADIVRSIAADIDCVVDFIPTPWARTIELVKHGELDMAIGASFKDERAKFAHYSPPYRGHPHLVATDTARSGGATSLQSFLSNKRKLGVLNGVHYTNAIRAILDAPGNAPHIQSVRRFPQLVTMFENDRIDGFLTNPSSLTDAIGKQRVDADFLFLPGDVDTLHILLSKKSVPADKARRFNTALASRLERGFFSEVCALYQAHLASPCRFLAATID